MKTNVNSKMTKGIVISMLALSLTGIATAQKPVMQSNADNRVKSFVYHVTSRVYQHLNYLVHLGNDVVVASNNTMNYEVAAPVFTSYTTAESRVKNERSLENFLIKAAGLNRRVNETEIVSTEETLNSDALEYFLTAASGLKETGEVSETVEIEAASATDNALEEFLTLASGLKNSNELNESFSPVENERIDLDLEAFLTEASGLKNPVEMNNEFVSVNENNATESLEEFLVRASGLKDQRIEANN